MRIDYMAWSCFLYNLCGAVQKPEACCVIVIVLCCEDPTARFVVPDLPSVHEGPDQFSEDGAMADLDREIRAALQLEDFEAHRYNLDLIQALEVDEGHLIDSD